MIDEAESEGNLDLSEKRLDREMLDLLVTQLNSKPKINTLTLRHNSLNNEAIPALKKLKHITYLDISYNDFTKKGIIMLYDGLVSNMSK